MNDYNHKKEAQEYFQKAIEESKSLSPKEALYLLMDRLFDWGDFEYDNIYGSEKELHEPILAVIDKHLVEIKKNKELVREITNELTKRIKDVKDAYESSPPPGIWFYPTGENNLLYMDVIEKICGLEIALPAFIEELKWIVAEYSPAFDDYGNFYGILADKSLLTLGLRILEVIALLKPKETIPLLIEIVHDNLSGLDNYAVRALGEIGGTEVIICLLFTKHNLFFSRFFIEADADVRKELYDPTLKADAEKALSKLNVKEETLSDKLFWEIFKRYKEFEFHLLRDREIFYDGYYSANHFRFAWAFKTKILENLSKFKDMIEEGIEHASIRLLALDFLYVTLERQEFTDYLIDFYPDNSILFMHFIEAISLEVGLFDAVPILLEQGKEVVVFNMMEKYKEKIFNHFKQNEEITAILKEISHEYK